MDLVLLDLKPYQVPLFIQDFTSARVVELMIAGTVLDVEDWMVTILQYNFTNADGHLTEHHLRRSDPHVRVNFIVMTYGEKIADQVIKDFKSVTMPALSWQMQRSIQEARMKRFYSVVIMRVEDVQLTYGIPAKTTTGRSMDNAWIAKTATAARSALPRTFLVFCVVFVATTLLGGARSE